MQYKVSNSSADKLKTPCLILALYKGGNLHEQAQAVDARCEGALRRFVRKKDFGGGVGETHMLHDLPGLQAQRVLLLGLGPRKDFSPAVLEKAVSAAATHLAGTNLASAALALPLEDAGDKDRLYLWARTAVLAADAALYRFTACKSENPSARKLNTLVLPAGNARNARRIEPGIAHGTAIAQGVTLARDLGNLPGNICTPTYLADEARRLARGKRKLKVSVLDEKAMGELGMGALLSVSRGSRQPACLIVMEYKGGKAGEKPVALVGKGLTFDAGGISIKPAPDMDQMKFDMCGGASVIGTMAACAELELPMNVVGIVPASENLPDGDANKPGDIVTSMSGQTIEVLNTDAEGRLILCDALTYTERFEPAAVVDIATLTGACVIALGQHASGLLANDDALAGELLAAGDYTHDRAWRLPLWDDYQAQLDSNFADMANIGGRSAGTITAACFLSRYTKQYKWAHLDIAGTAWKTGADKGSTGRPVPLLTQFLLKRCKIAG